MCEEVRERHSVRSFRPDSVPEGVLRAVLEDTQHADTIREGLGIDLSLKLLFGISFGYSDELSPANSYRISKAPVTDSVTFHA
jgi:nitroreductase